MPTRPPSTVDLTGEAIHWDLADGVTYGGYLQLPRILSAQAPNTAEHDELLFIIIHQTAELWMKLVLHEIDGAAACLREDRVRPALKMFARVARVLEQLTHAWSILTTMTPADYLKFRASLGQSSGFQSHQYRQIEFKLGEKNAALARVHESDADNHAAVMAALSNPSIYDETLRLLARAGFPIPESATERDWAEPYAPSDEVEAAWRTIYLDTETHWEHYELAEKLVDIEDRFLQWRFNHMTTVERIIGKKRGTGGSSGVHYLEKALDVRFFPELWSVRTTL